MAAVIERIASLPPDGQRVWYYPGARDHGHADVIVRVHRRDGSSWIACLPLPRDTPLVPTDDTAPGAFVLPCGERIYLAGGVVDRDEPESWRALPLREFVRACWSDDRTVVALSDGVSLAVFGPAGRLLETVEFAEHRVLTVSTTAVHCGVWDPALGDEVEQDLPLRG